MSNPFEQNKKDEEPEMFREYQFDDNTSPFKANFKDENFKTFDSFKE